LSVALCALLITGCTTGGPQGNGDLAGRQSKASAPPDVGTLTVVTLAENSRASGDLSSAISFYRRAINLDPSYAKAYVGLGETLLAAGAANEAVETFREAHDKWPNDPAILRGLGLALVSVNQPAAAAQILDQSIRIEPSPRAYGALGIAQSLLGNVDAADQAFRQGLVLAPDDLDLLNNFGLALALRGDYEAAIRTLRRVASDAKATARHRLNLALVLGLAGRNEDAAQIARIDLDERSVHSNLAYYTLLRGLSPEARAAAILRPGTPLPANAVAAGNCNDTPCSKPVLADNTVKAAPAMAVESAPLKPLAAAKAAMPASAGVEKPATKVPQATKPSTEDVKRSQAAIPAPVAPPPQSDAPQASPSAEVGKPAPAPATVPSTSTNQDKALPPPAWEAPKPLTQADEAASTTKADTGDVASTQEKKPAPAEKTDAAAAAAAPPPTETAVPAPKASDAAAAPTPLEPSAPMPAASAPAPAPTAPAVAPPNDPVVKASAATVAGAAAKHPTWLQIASFRSEQNAQTARRNMTNADPEFERLFTIRRVDLGTEKGVFYVLRMGPFETADHAHDFCAALRDRKIDCFISR
jgi:Flp pilus assembly protein TadD